ncbi:MAG: hypothetical protein R3F43_31850 [bacterium]
MIEPVDTWTEGAVVVALQPHIAGGFPLAFGAGALLFTGLLALACAVPAGTRRS